MAAYPGRFHPQFESRGGEFEDGIFAFAATATANTAAAITGVEITIGWYGVGRTRRAAS